MKVLNFTYIMAALSPTIWVVADTVSVSRSILILVVFLKKNYKKLALFLIKLIN